jgi:hypothetical protein
MGGWGGERGYQSIVPKLRKEITLLNKVIKVIFEMTDFGFVKFI